MVAITPLLLTALITVASASPVNGLASPKAPGGARRHHARLVQRNIQDNGARLAKKANAGSSSCKIRPVYTNGTAVPAPIAKNSTSSVIPTASVTKSSSATASSSASVSASVQVKVVTPTTSTSVYVAPTTTSTTPAASPTHVSSAGFTPNGKKAGIAGGDSFNWMQNHIGWWYDWSPAPEQKGSPVAVPMLWGDGQSSDGQDASRFAQFKSISSYSSYVIGFEEPDCSTSGSANIPDPSVGASVWNSVQAPWKTKGGSVLISPSMCKQADETWLTPFKSQISTPWDVTNVHINKNNMDGVRKDLDHYAQYGKPMWITEFACVDDSNWTPCTDQNEINSYINDIVALFEADSRVAAYAYSDGMGLGNVWPTVSNGQLSQSGQTYLNAISKYYP